MYKLLNNNYKYDLLAEQIKNREVNLFHYRFNIENYSEMINHADGDFRSKLEQYIKDEQVQLDRELIVYHALLKQIDDNDLFDQAVKRRATNVPA